MALFDRGCVEMTSYELLYFPARGRAEQVRLMFTLAEQPFTENPAADWAELKPGTPFGRLPVVTERSDAGEFELAESGAIMRHLARRHDMYGSDAAHHAMCDSLADFVADERTKYISVAYAATLGTSEDEIAQYWEQLPQTLRDIDRALARSTQPDAGWFITDTLTFADIATFDYLDALDGLKPGCLDAHPQLQAFVTKFRELPQVAPFLAERTRP